MGQEAPLTAYQSVRCLECGAAYAKPDRGGTVSENPGCPKCAYLGWLPLDVPDLRELARPRSVSDGLGHLPAR